MGMLLVTGGAGFIGSHLVDRLLERDDRVVCIDNFDPFYPPEIKRRNIADALNNECFSLVEGDIRNRDHLEAIFSGQEIESVIHLAARAGVRPSITDPLLYQDVNLKGTLNLLEVSKDHGVRNFIFGSSSSVYGSRDTTPFRETDDVSRPISPYAATKLAGEALCFTYHHLYNMPMSCLRFFTVYGPRHRPEMAIHKFTRLIDEGGEVELYGDGSSRRDYTFVSDIVDGIIAALDKKLDYEIVNLGGSETTQLKKLVSLIEEGLGKKARICYLPEQPGDVPITYADVSKARDLLGYKPRVKIEEGIETFIQWYRDRG